MNPIDLNTLGAILEEDHLVGHVISGWNSFQETGPIVIERASGCHIWDTQGNDYLDWIMGWGSLILGHSPEAVYKGIHEGLEDGFGYMYESPKNVNLSTLVSQLVPTAQKLRLANSGTEATLHALRVARAVTGRKKVVKFEGHFHGLNDYLLYGVDCGPRLGAQNSNGIITPVAGTVGLPGCLEDLIIIVPFNDMSAVEAAFGLHSNDIAAVILEPIALNIGCISPDPGFLNFLRDICDRSGALLIFDEVLTGFRVAPGGAQELYGVLPDLTCLGKAMGCGMPVAALCGRSDYMNLLTPVGSVEMAGTNTGRHLTVCGTLAAIKAMQQENVWQTLNELTTLFVQGCKELFTLYGVPAYVEGYGGRIGIHIGTEERPKTFRRIVATWNRDYHVKCYLEAVNRHKLFGFLLPLSICPEPVTLSALHTVEDINNTLDRLGSILKRFPYQHSTNADL